MVNFDLNDPVFGSYAFYATLVAVKMMMMSVFTIRYRLQHQSFANKEDFTGSSLPEEKRKPTFSDSDVERVRRCHLNDLENIPVFLIIGFLYVISGPNPVTALWHFRVFACSRFLHTFCYLIGIQPFRALSFGGGFMATLSMAWSVLSATWG